MIEIGTEELPPKSLATLAEALAIGMSERLQRSSLDFSSVEQYATPRRLGLLITQVAIQQPNQEQSRRGPTVQAAFDPNGQPTKAALGFATACGVTVAALTQEHTAKGSWLAYKQQVLGQPATNIIPNILQETLASLPIAKRMRWGSGTAEFARPVHWIVLIFGEQVITANILGINSDRTTRGHRFHHPDPIVINTPNQYATLLRNQGQVEPVFAERRAKIRSLVEQTAIAAQVQPVISEELLDEVTALCEWPVPILGTFDPQFLQVPAEALIATMQGHQKYFPVLDQAGKLAPYFITISNLVSKDASQVRAGNERVIRPRFADAKFFWDQDCKQTLDQHLPHLEHLVFQNKLGSMRAKASRLAATAAYIAKQIGLDPQLAYRSGLLCKCDLLTNMVGEFANLQGIMGRYLATAAHEPECVAVAMEEHYQPRYAGDKLPQSLCGQALALADRMDNLIGIFATGHRPSGLKDPYSMRRAALGVLRILIETPLELDLLHLATQAAQYFEASVLATHAIGPVMSYLLERLPSYYAEQGVSSNILEAVLETGNTVPANIDKRIKSLLEFTKFPEAASLAAANKRIRNILRQAGGDLPVAPPAVRTELLETAQELELYRSIQALQTQVTTLSVNGDYTGALLQLASLREPVDNFFEAVMVMVDNPDIRQNRLALLASLATLFNQIADFSKL
ncbi:glycyl-tRNA ligase [Achromatium sp. WMS2]|nr:glycyl-tRNA ligase [Achromatium sp. WMS2]